MSGLPTSTLLDTTGGTFLIPNVEWGDLGGTVTTRVYAPDPDLDTLGLGGLIFTYDISLSINPLDDHPLRRISTVDWASFAADAMQSGGGEGATSADRSATLGDVIGFNFLPLGIFMGGEVSTTLILVSDAPWYKASKVTLIDGGVDETPSFAPSIDQGAFFANNLLPMPDQGPGVFALALGCVALGLARSYGRSARQTTVD